VDTGSITTPVLGRIDIEPPVDGASANVVACPHCGGRIDAVSTSAAADAAAVVTEPGPRDADEVRAARVAVAAILRVMVEVIAGRRLSGQLDAVVAPSVLCYVRAARSVGGGALVLRSVRLCFPAEQVVEVAAVSGLLIGSGRWPPGSSTSTAGGGVWCSASCDPPAAADPVASLAAGSSVGVVRVVHTPRAAVDNAAHGLPGGGQDREHADRRGAPPTRHLCAGVGGAGVGAGVDELVRRVARPRAASTSRRYRTRSPLRRRGWSTRWDSSRPRWTSGSGSG
jgi:hypothetical protein